MDEWMQLTGGEATYRQQTQRAMWQEAPRTAGRDNSGRRVRAALATALVALAARLDTTLAQRQDATLSPANPA